MKRLILTFLALFIILTQQGSLEHAYHDHNTGEVCDYCINSKSLDHITVHSIQAVVHTYCQQWQNDFASQLIHKNHISYFAVRAPPRFI